MEVDKAESVLRAYYRKRIEDASQERIETPSMSSAGDSSDAASGAGKRLQRERPWLSLLLTAACLSFILIASSMRKPPDFPGTEAGASILSGSGLSPAALLAAWEKARFAFPNAARKGEPL